MCARSPDGNVVPSLACGDLQRTLDPAESQRAGKHGLGAAEVEHRPPDTVLA